MLACPSARAYGRGMAIVDIPADLDTLAATRDLEAAGIERRHAEAVIGVVRAGRAGLATKAGLNTGLAAVRADMRADLAALEARLYRAMWAMTGTIAGLIVAASGVVIAAIKLL